MIICFHEVKDVKQFEANLVYLRKCFHLLPLSSYSGLTLKHAYITFDDNYKSWLQALDLLEHYNVPAHFFVNTFPYDESKSPYDYAANLERSQVNETMSIADLELLDRSRIAKISSHTHSHLRLSANDTQQCIEDIRKSQSILRQLSSFDPKVLSYPFGRLSDYLKSDLIDMLKICQIEKAFTAIRLNHPIHRFAFRHYDKDFFIPRYIWEADKPPLHNLRKANLAHRLRDLVLPL